MSHRARLTHAHTLTRTPLTASPHTPAKSNLSMVQQFGITRARFSPVASAIARPRVALFRPPRTSEKHHHHYYTTTCILLYDYHSHHYSTTAIHHLHHTSLLLLLLLLHKVPIPSRNQIVARQKLERHTVASLHDDKITRNDLCGVALSLL
ncbi:hypothetical protein E2C01_065530 [Portunus trituberculatus]|uniref:Uncharacterized protein n=1 Tax=Portunus trituberculatus TaxID=210409 RepID=A0A5B7HNF4_PORTR|nr:hypothetical protein [Portunus trituberculatus]